MSSATLLDSAAMLGHKRIEQTRRYAHLTEGHTHGVVERMTRAVFGEPYPGPLRASEGHARRLRRLEGVGRTGGV
jgi:hypothetical protein